MENVVITLVAQIVITNFYNCHSHFHMKLLRSKLVSWLQSLTYKDSLSGVRSIIIVLILLENSKLFIFIVSLSNFFLIYLFTYTYKALLNLWCGHMHRSYICHCYRGEKSRFEQTRSQCRSINYGIWLIPSVSLLTLSHLCRETGEWLRDYL